MTETVTIPKAEYERLRALEEDFTDAQSALAIQAKIASGEEELIPAADRRPAPGREAPLRVWREYRHYTQVGLARASGVNRCRSSRLRRAAARGPYIPLASWRTRLPSM